VQPLSTARARTHLERTVSMTSCTPSSLALRLHVFVSEIFGAKANKGVRFLALEFADTRVFVKVEPGPRIVAREQQGGDPAFQLAEVPVGIGQWIDVDLGFDARRPAVERLTLEIAGRGIDVPPLTLDHVTPQTLRIGAVYVDDTAGGTLFIDDVELR
jgi:hypothetical protein